jgi:hypothetical protein
MRSKGLCSGSELRYRSMACLINFYLHFSTLCVNIYCFLFYSPLLLEGMRPANMGCCPLSQEQMQHVIWHASYSTHTSPITITCLSTCSIRETRCFNVLVTAFVSSVAGDLMSGRVGAVDMDLSIICARPCSFSFLMHATSLPTDFTRCATCCDCEQRATRGSLNVH